MLRNAIEIARILLGKRTPAYAPVRTGRQPRQPAKLARPAVAPRACRHLRP